MKKQIVVLVLLAAALAACGAPAAEKPDGTHGPVYFDSLNVLVLESFPIQLRLVMQGNLPTPCHELAYTIAAPNAANEIHIEVYTTVDPAVTCMQVLQPFDESIAIPLDGVPDGEYSLWVNGEQAGEFSYPG
ncbi:MAG: hypothetical protein KIS88_04785 [Anaerolineales bacterium]|nr:hypothetical protein [Anaerolineales bacterium]